MCVVQTHAAAEAHIDTARQYGRHGERAYLSCRRTATERYSKGTLFVLFELFVFVCCYVFGCFFRTRRNLAVLETLLTVYVFVCRVCYL